MRHARFEDNICTFRNTKNHHNFSKLHSDILANRKRIPSLLVSPKYLVIPPESIYFLAYVMQILYLSFITFV